MLHIVKATEPVHVENIVVTVYAKPGLGKSTLGLTAEDSILLDFDKGYHRAGKRGAHVDIENWSNVDSIEAADLDGFKTIVVDTAGHALDFLTSEIIDRNPKAGRADGALSLQGYGTLKTRFGAWLRFVRSLKKDIVLVCHLDEQKNGDDILERIEVQGGSKNIIYESSDAMCRIMLDNRGHRTLDFDPHANGFGKNPARLPKIPFNLEPSDTLAKVISQIKNEINRQTDAQVEAVKAAAAQEKEWAEAISECSTLEKFNAQAIPLAKDRNDKGFSSYVKRVATERKYTWDKEASLYVEEK